jgi:hypothetical protein
MKNTSIAIFGSSQRTNFDKYSDKDLLIVGESYSKINELRQEYESQNYSVSTYTYKKLQFLSDSGSLFIQHLKKESKILIDGNDNLKSILDNHKESIPTQKELTESIDYFKFLKSIPNSNWGYAWFCDCFYVGLRNHLILRSAIKGDYNFSFLNLIDDLLQSKEIDLNDFEILRQVRVVKKAYRERIDEILPSQDFMNSLVAVGQKLKLIPSIDFISCENFKSYVVCEVKNQKTNHYFKLRLFEVYYILSGQRNSKIDKYICNPQMYALKFKNTDFICKLIDDLEKNGTQQHLPKRRGFVFQRQFCG